MRGYTVKDIDDYLVRLTNSIEQQLPTVTRLTDFRSVDQVYGVSGIFTNTEIFTISFEIPAAIQTIDNVPNIYLKFYLNENLSPSIDPKKKLKNHKRRNEFIKYLFDKYCPMFNKTTSIGTWNNTQNINIKSSVSIYVHFNTKQTLLPPIKSVVDAIKLFLNINIDTELDNWQP